MDKQSKKTIGLFIRYITLLILGLGNLYIIYTILTPLTVKTLAAILSITMDPVIINTTLYTKGLIIQIIPACVAGAAFYLLLFLILSTANIKPRTRAKAIITAVILLFVLNIFRLVLLSSITNTLYFETIHWLFWHIISTAFVIIIWLTIIKLYKIKSIPIYSDVKFLTGLIKPIKNTKRRKKNN